MSSAERLAKPVLMVLSSTALKSNAYHVHPTATPVIQMAAKSANPNTARPQKTPPPAPSAPKQPSTTQTPNPASPATLPSHTVQNAPTQKPAQNVSRIMV